MMPILAKQIDNKNSLSKRNKTFIFLFALLTAVAMLLLPSAKAQQTVQQANQQIVEHEVIQELSLNQAELDQILAPIALYPDSLLSQILVASTYPLEVVQATRWRQANSSLDENQVLSAVDSKDWDPSVKALAPFEDLLVRISEDLEWLQSVGDAFLQNEDQVLASVQNLRQVAYENGSIEDNDYYQVTTEDDNIIIESTQREIVYVPYYDTRVVYGNWRWAGYAPIYWDRPRNYVHLSGGFYWNSSYFIRPNIFFGGFHWGSRRLVVNHHYYDNYYGYNGYSGYDRRIPVSSYSHWSHNPAHRRGVRYPQKVVKSYTSPNRSGSANTRNTVNRAVVNTNARQSNTRQTSVNKVQQKLSTIKRTTANTSAVDRRQAVGVGSTNRQVTTTNRQVTTARPTTNRNTATTNSRTTVNKTTSTRRTAPVVTNTQRRNSTLRQATVNKQTTRTNTTTKASSTSNTSSAKTSSATSTPQTTTTTTTTSNRGKWSR